jgi:hypothetical protein
MRWVGLTDGEILPIHGYQGEVSDGVVYFRV